MKFLQKYLLLAFTACALFMVTACSDSSKAGDVAVEFTEAMLEGDTETCFSYLYLDDLDGQYQQLAKGKIDVVVKGVSQQAKGLGGLDSVKLIEVKDNKTDENRKRVKVEYTLNNGSSKSESYNLKKNKDGDWKIELK